jgi:hypothetical protein
MKRIAIALGAAALLALGLPAAAQASPQPIPGSAVPAAAGPNVYTPEQVGYGLTGNTFRTVTQTVILPDASKFAPYLTGFGESVQLISSKFWAILGISDSTTTSPWSPAFAIFNMATKTLICGTGAPPCGSSAESGAPMTAGDHVTQVLSYNSSTGFLTFTVTDTSSGGVFSGSYQAGSTSFSQVRSGTEFGADPFHQPPSHTAPPSQVAITSLSLAKATSTSGHTGPFGGDSHWVLRKLIWTRNGQSTGAVNALPSSPHTINGGSAYNTYLEP